MSRAMFSARRAGAQLREAGRVALSRWRDFAKRRKDERQDKAIQGLKRTMNAEIKFATLVSYANATTSAGSLGTEFYLSGLAQGVDQNQRVGDHIQVKWIYLNWRFVANTGAANQVCRVIIFQDFGNIGASPQTTLQSNVMTGTLANVTAPGQGLRFDLMLRSKKNRSGRFKVLYDSGTRKIGPLSTSATFATATDNSQVLIQKRIRVNSPTKYIGTGATTASAGNGTIWMYTMSSDSTNITELGHVSIHYLDK